MYIDRIDWHIGGGFPGELPNENGGTHIGMYLAWVINNNLQGSIYNESSVEALQSVRNRKITGRDFLVQESDGKFVGEGDDLNDEGLAFTEFYYSSVYIDDYVETLTKSLPSIYHVEDTWENYDKIAPVINKRFEDWKNCQGK